MVTEKDHEKHYYHFFFSRFSSYVEQWKAKEAVICKQKELNPEPSSLIYMFMVLILYRGLF